MSVAGCLDARQDKKTVEFTTAVVSFGATVILAPAEK